MSSSDIASESGREFLGHAIVEIGKTGRQRTDPDYPKHGYRNHRLQFTERAICITYRDTKLSIASFQLLVTQGTLYS
jgi:hypothetical protein